MPARPYTHDIDIQQIFQDWFLSVSCKLLKGGNCCVVCVMVVLNAGGGIDVL